MTKEGLISLCVLVPTFTLIVYTDTHCSIHISKWSKAARITIPIYALTALPLWFMWKNIYAFTQNAWQAGLIAVIPCAIGKLVGTYLATNQWPSKLQIIALLINLLATIISQLPSRNN